MLSTLILNCVANKFTTHPLNMEVKNLGYSLNNIPIPAKQHCLKSMIDKVERIETMS